MTTIDLDFEIINKSHETDLLNSIQDILNVKNVKLNNPLINDYIFKVFKNKIEYNELYIPKDEIQQSRPNSPKRPNTPIHNLHDINNSDLDNIKTEEHLNKCIKKINSCNTSHDCNLSFNNSTNSCNSDNDSDNDSDISTSSINSDSSITLLLNNKKKKEDIQKLFNKHNYNILTKYKLEKLNNVVKEFDDTNNIVCDLDLNSLTTQQKNTFIKISPLIEPIHYIKTYLPSSPLNNNNNNNNHHLTPDINTLSLVKKINSKYNSCYVEAFMGFLLNKLIETNTCIGYPHFYGCFTGIKENIHFDISEDYDDIKHKSWFKNKEHSTLFTKKTIYEEETSDEEEENNDEEDTNNDDENNEEKTNNKEEIIDETQTDKDIEEILDLKDLDILDEVLDIDISPEELELNLNNKSKKSSSLKSNHSSSSTYSINSNNSENSYTIDNISECSDIDFRDKIDVVEFPQFPINASIMEKFEFTLDELLDDMDYEICEDEWLSILFQIIYNLMVAQKYYKMCHNDLHSSNIMFENTNITHLYYTINSKHYKIKTYGKILKIIDFGRASFYYNNEWFISDVFSDEGDAEGQIEYPTSSYFNPEKSHNSINYSFDLVRLATTIYERFDDNKIIRKFLNKWMKDDYNENVINLDDDFSLYIHISKYCHNAKPSKVICDPIFNIFTINKLPLKSSLTEKELEHIFTY